MKTYPRTEQDTRQRRLSRLPLMQKAQRYLALIMAFVSVFIFFIKILFF